MVSSVIITNEVILGWVYLNHEDPDSLTFQVIVTISHAYTLNVFFDILDSKCSIAGTLC